MTFRRSNAWECVAGEVAAVRERVGVTEISNYAKYRVTGPGAEAWLSSLLTARMPQPGRIVLTAMLNEAGRIVGEFTVARPTAGDEYYLFGSLAAEVHHPRWFAAHLPADGSVTFEVLGLSLVGLSIAGPARPGRRSAKVTDEDLSTRGVPVHGLPARSRSGSSRHSSAGSTTAASSATSCGSRPSTSAALFDRIMAAGEEHGIRLFGFRALMSLRLEKSYGTWYREYRPIYTLHEAGLQRYVKLDHEFIGRAAYEKEAETGPERRLVALVVEPDPDAPADVIGDEPIWHDGAVVGWVTSGSYGHHVEEVDRARVRADGARHAGRPGRRRFRDRDHRAAPAGPAPARAAVRPRGPPDAPVSEVAAEALPASAAPAAGGSSSTGGRVAFEAGDSVAIAILRGGEVPGRGGTLCLAGDCGNCLAEVDGTAYVRTCQTAARPGLRVARHPAGAMPPLPVVAATDLDGDAAPGHGRAPPPRGRRRGHRRRVERARPRPPRRSGPGKSVRVLDAHAGEEVVAIYAGPMIVVRTTHGMLHVHPREIVVATGRRRDPSGRARQPAGRDRHGARRGASCGPPAWTWAGVVARRTADLVAVRGRRTGASGPS